MDQSPGEAGMGNSLLEDIDEGMEVYDVAGDKVGTVERVFLGAASESELEAGKGPATAPDPRLRQGGTWIDFVADLFDVDEDIPDVLKKRLLREGFIRVDGAGLFAADRFVTPDQIASVIGDRVNLRVDKEALHRD